MPAKNPPHRAWYLAKTDPDTYSIDDLERDKQTVWDGVRNPTALRAIRAMKTGDRAFVYHSMGASAIVGIADIVSDSRPDPKDPKLTVVDLRFLRRIDPPVTLRAIKDSGLFNDWALVRQSRLSTMPAPEEFVLWMREQTSDSSSNRTRDFSRVSGRHLTIPSLLETYINRL